ncbi:hypothetical protein AJ79_07832 [Helicocarpus griseus UAMH5409]|uniref:Uncharacterized protein n=1 Tax=Helicocarpus griseus UAMH5409 TaxID=1447875 RepID=A0A2B7WQY3_9EURO|nr:hypothetical protein AJ79_07832 [Helicocarpus griseus UAMH5409]
MKPMNIKSWEERLTDPENYVSSTSLGAHSLAKKIITQKKNQLKAKDELYQNGGERVGKVFAASGLRRSGPRVVDWALIKVDESRIGYNKLPKNPQPPCILGYHTHSPIAHGFCIVTLGIAPIKPGMDVYKIGRTTQFTGGHLEEIETTNLHFWEEDCSGTWIEEYESRVYTVFKDNAPGGIAFGREGDDAAFVMDGLGHVVGLYIGGSDALRDIGFMTSADGLIADIKRMTGAMDVSFDFWTENYASSLLEELRSGAAADTVI